MNFADPLRTGAAGLLVGRDQDLERICEFLASPDTGGALVLSGEPGVGKTAFLDAVAKAATEAGTRVLRAAGVQFEADVSYSGLNQALLPLRHAFDNLGTAHRDAIRVALGFGAGAPPQRLVLSNAALALLQAAAADSPVLVIVDDLPWVDRASAAVFGFIARRLSGSRVGFLAASRTGTDSFFESGGLPTYELPPLDEESATLLVDLRFPGLARQVRRRLLDAAQGNPLALLELPSSLRAGQRKALESLPVVLPLSQRLQSLFFSRVQRLPVATQRLLLLATLDGTGDLGTLYAAAREMNGEADLEDLAPAERDQLVHLDEGVRRLVFRHPLISSVVVEASTGSQRRAAHRALAQVLTNEPQRRAWHLGEATLEPDEQVALQLEQAARRILKRGDAEAAIAALTRAADLSPLGADRARRLGEAAYIGAEATGALRSASELLEDARRADPKHARSLHSAATAVQLLLNGDGDVATAHRLLVGAIEDETHHYDVGNVALVDAMHLLLLLCFYGGEEELWPPFHAALSRLRPEAPPVLTVASQTVADPARTGTAALEQLDLILNTVVEESDPARIVRIGTASIYPDRLSVVREPSWRIVRQGRDGGPARRHLCGLVHLCLDGYHSGRWDEVAELADEGLQLCETSGYSFLAWYFHYNKGMVTASRGDTHTARALADRMTKWATPRGVRSAIHFAQHVRAVASIADGDFEAAFHHATAISPAGSLAAYAPHALWVVFDLVESAVRTKRRAEAIDHVRALHEARVGAFSPRLALLAGGCAALSVEDDDAAARLFEKALGTPGADRWPFDMARVQLAQGERLRRARATTESRSPLVAALKTFEQLGSRAWGERAAKELRAVGWQVPKSEERGGRELTPQEREIAQLAASGLTNKQIAERHFISHRTVGAHLYQIYRKLGIGSRAALRDALTAREAGESAP
ncbi:LuxR family transcriptional regulator [Streptomyces spinoverrucosus]|uniref:LuxR family transcriptional regulator n=1 Tax=Streptomyces spinoverrucosus TaxID=284043 RepID=A0A4Y3V8B4_9ACTN|nr:LuxR family transcriptional regulator [Streptomyces spinoverrucosus]GEC03207.1 LuxR family transcriptional regulator [Streptomyces spinoverrucosus]GHB37400.1 LuxR family transcriptional regulator [Streptomyces spinoverrucosus]